MNLQKYASRQFLLVILTLFGGFWFAWSGKLTNDLTAFVTVVLAPYLASGAYQNIQRLKLGATNDNSSPE